MRSVLFPANNPDAIALAETLAPSQPAPPMPLTAEERQLVRATRPGAPIEVAELDQLREPLLRAVAAQRERTHFEHYAAVLIAPLLAFQNSAPSTPPESSPSDANSQTRISTK
jgi:hypothetical protein